MKKRTIYIENGESLVPYNIYSCAFCGKDVEESWPMEIIDGEVWCGDCAFKMDLIDERLYVEKHLYFMGFKGVRAAFRDDILHIAINNEKFPWERTNKQDRRTKQYEKWRTSIFERDEYRCAICKNVGGRLNAHHIKPFSKFKNERYDIHNGITLCEACHKRVHKEKDPRWIEGVE